ncbi:MAG: Lrp/AsnC family transcriptional regulator [Candidatus Heimdallarchaeota archaeon]|nr:Lrp/AsnC family transcriptional regulator [Candidatus Heimdallarchaeota archaeon]
MKGFARDLLELLRILENYPLLSYSEHAKMLNVSTQTLSRRVEKLQNEDMLRKVHSTLKPEKMELEKYVVIFEIAEIDQLEQLELSCDIHPYTSSRNRLFGQFYGVYAVFDIPKGSEKHLVSFLDFTLGREFCSHYQMFKSVGRRLFYPQPLHNNITDIDEFDIDEYFSRKIEIKTISDEKASSANSVIEFHPIHLLILRDITTNMRTPVSKLAHKYKLYLELDKSRERFDTLPKGFRPYLEEFFSDKRTENAVYIDFKKKYQYIINNIVEDYWWGVNRKYFEMFVRFTYIIFDITKAEKSRLFSLFKEFRPPFSIYIEDLGKNIGLTFSLPPYYQIKVSYWIKSNYERFSVYLADSFGNNATKYRFYVHNYDLKNLKWREDKDWMLDGVVKGIQEKIANNQ